MTAAHARGLLAGYAADRLLGDPRRGHPVAGFGRLAQRTERALYRDHRAAGVAYAGVLTAGVAAGTLAAGALARAVARVVPARRPGRHPAVAPYPAVVWSAAVTWAALGGRSLAREATALAAALDRGDLATARELLPSLCARDPATLDAGGLARAAAESVAENTCDAVVAPLCWGAVAGPAGVATYRAVNTLDAMVGYRSTRYRRFGWAAARLDDAANWLPARLTAALACALAPVVGGSPGRAWATWRRYGHDHPSPNAGRVEAAFAGALHRRLGGGANRYGDHLDHRPALGEGPDPTPADLRRAVRLASAVGAAAAVLAAGLAAGRGLPGGGRR